MSIGNKIRDKRAIIDRRAVMAEVDELAENCAPDDLRGKLVELLSARYNAGWSEIKTRFETGDDGRTSAVAHSFLVDQIIRVLFDTTVQRFYPLGNPTESERVAIVATGGYGRGELAPFSDVDLLFLMPYKTTPWVENVVESMLYTLWDMGLKVGHATRSAKDCVRLAKTDLTIKTSLLDSRFIWGDQALFDSGMVQFQKDVLQGTGPAFVEAKLGERDARHRRMGDTRYVVEPNLKEGKGGMRDMQTLYWISRYLYGVRQIGGLVDEGVITAREARRFEKAENYLWTVRHALHYNAGRPSEVLTFDIQPELAQTLKYRDAPGLSRTERFMKHYFLVAKEVGDLTRVFCASLEARHQKRSLMSLSRFGLRKKIAGFTATGGRLNAPDDKLFKRDPVQMLRIFQIADETGFDIHPDALRLIRRNLKVIDAPLREDPAANACFVDILTSRNGPETALKRMNEAGVFGRFIPDFGRVVAQMQHDMYHHYTVDEHTIRAIGILSRIEKGELEEDHPIAARVVHELGSRRVLYVAVLLHDIAKGRGGDHSVLGEQVARELCPRLGLTAAETDNVAWLVKHHLHMSGHAFKRDLSDPKTIEDFVNLVKSPERLKLLLLLTVVDIRAVGPGVWNAWKRSLLSDLYGLAEESLVVGHVVTGRAERVAEAQQSVRDQLAWADAEFDTYAARFADAYWIAEQTDTQERNARLIALARQEEREVAVSFDVVPTHDMTRVSVYAADQPGLFWRIAGALAEIGANIVDAKIFTTLDGMAVDNFAVQDADSKAFEEPRKLSRIRDVIERAILTDHDPATALNRRPLIQSRTEVFQVEPFVIIDNKASNSHSVVEVNARDRTGLLYDLARAFYESDASIISAHIATYGERAVDVFYVQDLDGWKIEVEARTEKLEAALLTAARGGVSSSADKIIDQKTAVGEA